MSDDEGGSGGGEPGHCEDDSEILLTQLQSESSEDETTDAEKIKNVKSRYMKMFDKNRKEDEEKEAAEKKTADDVLVPANANPTDFGIWDKVNTVKALPTLMRVKKEWVPPDWEETLKQLKKEGKDVASIDKDLKEINHQVDKGKAKTGKYLMPDDLVWLRKHAKFKEKDLLKWLRRFRQAAPKGEMNRDEFEGIFHKIFPAATEPRDFTDIVFDYWLDEEQQDHMDFKDFIVALDVLTCKTITEKLRWAFLIFDPKRTGYVSRHSLKAMLRMLDQVEENGFVDEPPEEVLDELLYKRNMEPAKLVEDRADDIMARIQTVTVEGNITLDDFVQVPEKVIYARE